MELIDDNRKESMFSDVIQTLIILLSPLLIPNPIHKLQEHQCNIWKCDAVQHLDLRCNALYRHAV